MTPISRRTAIKFAASIGSAGLFANNSVFAQAAPWPSKPITLTVGFPPGGLTDASARAITHQLGKALGQSVVVDNKPGAASNLASAEILRSAPDGYKLLVAISNITINPHTFSTPSPDPMKFVPIGIILQSPMVLCVNPSVPANNLDEFIAHVKKEAASSRGFAYASSGAGGVTNLMMELLRDRLKLPNMTHVAYRGSGPALQDVVGNQVPCILDATSLTVPFIQAGKLRPILVTGANRSSALPEVPTAMELGFKDINYTIWSGIFGPPGLPAEIVIKVNAALNKTLEDPTVKGLITKNGDEIGGGSPEKLASLIREQYKVWGDVVRTNNIRAE